MNYSVISEKVSSLKSSLLQEDHTGQVIDTTQHQHKFESTNDKCCSSRPHIHDHDQSGPKHKISDASTAIDEFWYKADEHEDVSKNVLKKLCIVTGVCLLFISVEITGGLMSQSLAILSDAAHLFSDLLGFVFSMCAVFLARGKATKKMTFGYHRAEILGALVNVLLILVLSTVLLYCAVLRFITPPKDFDANFMLGTAIFGLICNLVMVKVLHGNGGGHAPGQSCSHDHSNSHSHGHHDHKQGHSHSHKDEEDNHSHGHQHHDHHHDHHSQDHHHDHQSHDHHDHHHHQEHKNISKIDSSQNANIRAAMIHIIGDILQSVGVVIAAIVIKIWPQAQIVDPICTCLFAVIVCFTTIPVIRTCVGILMESSPSSIDIDEFNKDLKEIEGVENVHDLHVWSLTEGKPSMSAHISGENTDFI